MMTTEGFALGREPNLLDILVSVRQRFAHKE